MRRKKVLDGRFNLLISTKELAMLAVLAERKNHNASNLIRDRIRRDFVEECGADLPVADAESAFVWTLAREGDEYRLFSAGDAPKAQLLGSLLRQGGEFRFARASSGMLPARVKDLAARAGIHLVAEIKK